VTYRKRRPVLIVAVILLLAACGGTASSVTHTPAAAPTAAALVKGEFVGVAGSPAGIALSTNGRQVIAYFCNGTFQHISLAQWFSGPVTGNRIDITNAHGAHLVATVTAQAITGTVTLDDGTPAPFTARLIPHPGTDNYGLFRSEETFHGVRYLGGWMFNPVPLASARTATGTEAALASVMVPMPTCCIPDAGGGGIINEQTGALIITPHVDGTSVTVPGLGTFRLTPCREAQC
jgi:hypothetical protein